jgi:hypothetical protein
MNRYFTSLFAGRRMRTTLRFLLSLAISALIATAVVPAAASVVPPPVRSGCCAKVKIDAPANDCRHQAPKPDPDKQCCVACPICLALFLASTTPSIYPPSGGEFFAAVFAHPHVRAHRPPVPPPRS